MRTSTLYCIRLTLADNNRASNDVCIARGWHLHLYYLWDFRLSASTTISRATVATVGWPAWYYWRQLIYVCCVFDPCLHSTTFWSTIRIYVVKIPMLNVNVIHYVITRMCHRWNSSTVVFTIQYLVQNATVVLFILSFFFIWNRNR